MGIIDLYSKRKAKREGQGADVFTYDEIPQPFRVQVVQILEEAFLLPDQAYSRHYEVSEGVYKYMVQALRREKGVFQLGDERKANIDRPLSWPKELFDYLLFAPPIDFLDALEVACQGLFAFVDLYENAGAYGASKRFPEALEEINYRLREAGLGYQYRDKELIRVDSQFIHSDAVVPALEILRLPGYKGSQSEFLKAHEHYRHGRNAEALNECYKAFESLMKSICEKHKWNYDKGWAAAKLVDVCIKNGLIPAYYHSHLIGLKSILESAIPTPRNKTGAHGAGTDPIEVPSELASYVIHLTASTLLYLATMEARIK